MKRWLITLVVVSCLVPSAGRAVTVKIDSLHGQLYDTLFVPLHIRGQEGRGVIGVDITLSFRDAVLKSESAFQCGRPANGWMTVVNPQPGQLTIAMAGASPLGAGDTLVVLRCFIVAPDSSTISFVQCQLNEGQVVCTTRAGMLVLPVTDVENEQSVPRSPSRLVVEPNPMRQCATVSYDVTSTGPVAITIIDTRGQVVRVLTDEGQLAGRHCVEFGRCGVRGSLLPDGVYFVRLEAPDFRETRKLVLTQ